MVFDPGLIREAFRNAERELKRRDDERDFNDEMAGRPTFKIPRFLSADARDARRDERAGGMSRRADAQTRLQLLLASNPAYAIQYQRTFDALRGAETATDRALARATEKLEKAREALNETMSRAARLPDGTRVFRDRQGNIWTEHGRRVEGVDAASIAWRGDEPAYEEFLQQSEAVKEGLTLLEELQGFRVNTLGRIRDRMMDEDNPPAAEELDRFRREMEEAMPAAVKHELAAGAPAVIPDTGFEIAGLQPL